MFSVLVPHAQNAPRRFVIYASCLSSILLAASLMSIHGRLKPSKGVLMERGTPASASRVQPGRVAGYGKLPLSFEANQGQADVGVKFLARGRGYGLFLTSSEATLELQRTFRRPSSVVSGQNQEARSQERQGFYDVQWGPDNGQRTTDSGRFAAEARLCESKCRCHRSAGTVRAR